MNKNTIYNIDAFSGSGSVLAYARELNRNVIGFEKSQKFYDMSCARFATNNLDIAFA
ncbi:DNA methyltransferase [Achromobacter sp.]|uniref:DNA methyltransferase n=1 Tax=Achromobacter sp. TaxID=134375 RepID=UPI0033904CC6